MDKLFIILIKTNIKFVFAATGSGGYPRPSLLPPREAALALHHPSELLARPYADQLAHQVLSNCYSYTAFNYFCYGK